VRAIGYIRVSTEKEATEGISLDTQKIRLQAHCIAVVGTARLEASALDPDGRKADALVVVKLDRLTRNLRDFAYLIDSYFGEGRSWSLLSVFPAAARLAAAGGREQTQPLSPTEYIFCLKRISNREVLLLC
jgi:hypothetical protein